MRIIIIGNSGAGKTWLASKIASQNQLPIIHLDDLFWKPGGFDQKRDESEIEELISKSKEKESWIAEGVFGDLAQKILSRSDLVIWLNIEWDVCCSRLKRRGSESKEHLGRKQSEEGLKKLIQWASCYHTRETLASYSGHKKIFQSFKGHKVLLQTEKETNLFLKQFLEKETKR